MKQIARKFLLSAVLTLALVLSACCQTPSGTESKENDKTPYEQGLELIDLITEIAASEAYLKAVVNSAEIMNQAAAFAAGDRTTPLAVYAITWNSETITNTLIKEIGQSEWGRMSEALRMRMISMAKSSFISQVNSQSGQYAVAAATLCTASSSFVNDALKEDVVYLYTYQNAAPVAVTFIVGEDNRIGASAIFIANDKLDCTSAETVQAFFNTELVLAQVTKLEIA